MTNPPAGPTDPTDPNYKPQVTNSEVISEALAKHAAMRPPKAKPRIMPVTPIVPRIPKPYKNKNKRRTD